MKSGSFLFEVLQTIAEHGRWMIGQRQEPGTSTSEFSRLCHMLLAGRGEASGLALAAEILNIWRLAGEAERTDLLLILANEFGPDERKLDGAISAYQRNRDARSAMAVHEAAEPLRQELFRRLNMAQGATGLLLEMRVETARHLARHPELKAVDDDFVHLLSSWFNRGFLRLRRIDWSTPANILEKIIQYEAVHEIRNWDDLKRRLAPEDRRCFAFFHPQLIDEPLIFVEIALTRHMPSSIGEVINEGPAAEIPAESATTAVFYSISNCQAGLRGISFGNFLLKQVIEELRHELPGIVDFVTLSPVTGFVAWLRKSSGNAILAQERAELISLTEPGWQDDPEAVEQVSRRLPALAAEYLVRHKASYGLPADSVARFHLGNGARLERINMLGDLSPKALAESCGLMVNYRYKLDDLVKNHERFTSHGEVVAAPGVRRLLVDRYIKESGAAAHA